MSDSRVLKIKEAAQFLSSRIGGVPFAGIVLGTGLGRLADEIQDAVVIPYSEIPNFPVSTAIGHKGNFIYGILGGKKVLAMQGRFHYYEGYSMEQVTLPVRVMNELGCKLLFVSNASGGLNYDYRIGDLIILRDHINTMPNPLIGPNMDEYGTRFPDMTHAYDPALRKLAAEIAAQEGIEVREGVYAGCTGPSYETRAEYGYFRTIGGDLVGMSTIPEVIVASHCGMKVFGVSVVTDLAHEDLPEDYVTDGEAIVAAADKAAGRLSTIVRRMLERL